MPAFRYDTSGTWYKGNCHIHSTASDGCKTRAELGKMYAESGYGFLVLTDPWVASQSRGDDDSSPLLWMDGIELDGHDGSGSRYHVVCLGSVTGVQREMGFFWITHSILSSIAPAAVAAMVLSMRAGRTRRALTDPGTRTQGIATSGREETAGEE